MSHHRVWRVVPRVDKLGNRLWALEYDPTFPGGVRYGLWREDRVFRDEARAMDDLAYLALKHRLNQAALDFEEPA